MGWLIEFYPQGPRKGIFVSSKAHVSPPTHILSDQGDPLVVRPGSRTQVTCTEGEKPLLHQSDFDTRVPELEVGQRGRGGMGCPFTMIKRHQNMQFQQKNQTENDNFLITLQYNLGQRLDWTLVGYPCSMAKLQFFWWFLAIFLF